MKQLTKSTVVIFFLAVGCILPQFLWAATATNRQAAGTTDYWTNNAVWTASPYPGSAPNESAYLTTNMAGSYTNILNATLANSISNLVISNSLGNAWLVITNAAVTNAALFNMQSGARLRIDNGGILSANGTLSNTEGRIYINSGGAFYQKTNFDFFVGRNSLANSQLILTGGGIPALYDGGSNRLYVGYIAASNNLLVVDGNGVSGGAIVTNVIVFQIGRDSPLNTTIVTNGGQILMKAGSITVGQLGNIANPPANRNTLVIVGNPAVSTVNLMAGDFSVGIGSGAGLVARDNTAVIDGGGMVNGAILTNANNVYIGTGGSGGNVLNNRMIVTNGGVLYSGPVTVGNAATNVAYLISGGVPGSVVSNGAITVGSVGSLNAWMSVADANLRSGGAVILGSASQSNTITVLSNTLWNGLNQAFTIGTGAGGSSNTMTVDGGGAGSAVVSNVLSMMIGNSAANAGNVLLVTNGGRFLSGAVTVGNTGTTATNNTYIVDGGTAGNGLITMGGLGNQMRVANGASLSSTGMTFGGLNNTATVSSASIWDFSNGALTFNANTGVALTVNSGAVVTNVGGISLSGVQQAYYLTNAGSAKNIFLGTRGYLYVGGIAAGSSGMHSNTLVLANQTFTGTAGNYNWVGINSSFNTLTLLSNTLWNANGEDLVIGNGYSTSFVGASNNLVVVDGGGVTGCAVITNLNSIRVGWAGGAAGNTGIAANNRMVITNGGCVSVAGAGYIGDGQYTNVIGNSVLVVGGAGATSRWDMVGALSVPATAASPGGTNSSLVIDGAGVPDGAVVSASEINVERGSTVLVTNRGALLLGAGNLGGVGAAAGNSNSLMIVAGSRFDEQFYYTRYMSIGYGNNNNYNLVLVRGTNSLFNVLPSNINTTKIRVGGGGVSSWNVFRIEDYAVATGADFIVGLCSAAGSAVGNLLSITGGGKLYSGGGNANQIGYSAAAGQVAAFNTGLVSGVDSVWNVGSPPLMVGYAAPSNVLWIADGAMVTNVMGLFKVGEGVATYPLSSGNKVVITNGAKLYTLGNAYVGGAVGVGQMSNNVLITGSSSLWDMGGAQLNLGLAANTVTDNWVTIDNGATLDNVGTLAISTNNRLYLTWGTLGVSNTVAGGYTNGLFTVGDATNPSTLKTIVNGAASFMGGLLITSNSSVSGFGNAGGGSVGVIVTNGAFMDPGVSGAGALTIGGSNLTWAGGGVYRCEITNMNLNVGLGWDLVNVSTQLNLAGTSGNKMEIRMDSRAATPAANFSPVSDYTLKVMTYGSMSGYDPNNFYINTNAFPGSTSAWNITNANNALYLVYRGASPLTFTPDFTWNAPNNGNWSQSGNWASTAAVPAVGGSNSYVLSFGGSGATYLSTNNLTNAASQFLVNQLVLNAGSGSNQIVGSGSLVFTNTGAALYQQGMGQFRLAHNLLLAVDPVGVFGNGAGNVYLASNVTVAAAGRLLLQGQGAWSLISQASNNFNGPVVMNAPNATLQLESDMALNGASGGSVTVSNGTVNSQPASGNVAIGPNVSNRRLLLTGPYSVLRVNSRPPLMIGSSTTSAAATNTSLTVDNGARFNGALDVSYSTVTGQVSGCSLVITNGGQVFNDAVTPNYVGYAGVTNASALVTGPNSMWDLGRTNLFVASTNLPTTRNSSLTVQAGGVVTNANMVLLGGSSNTITVASTGLLSSITLSVGDGGSSSNNMLTVDNATLVTTNNLIVGNNGAKNNSLVVQNGGVVDIRNGTLSWGAGTATNNSISVDGTSCITNVGTLAVNDAGRTVVLANGLVDGKNIRFLGGALTVGTGSNAAPASIIISNTTLNTSANVGSYSTIGYNSSFNTLTVSASGLWNNGNQGLYLGGCVSGFSTSNNTLLIDGGSIYNVNRLGLGGYALANASESYGNSLIITNGGRLVSSNALIGGASYSAGSFIQYSRSNIVLVTGSGSIWSNINQISVGGQPGLGQGQTYGNSNVLSIANSGMVYAVNLLLSRDGSIGWGNLVQVDGTGSALTVTGSISIGFQGFQSSNKLIIANGGRVIGNSTLVYGGDQILVKDSGTVLTNSGSVTIGAYHASNPASVRGAMTVTNGAKVFSQTGGIGNNGGWGASNLPNSNTVVVTGSGSQWMIANSNFDIGNAGANNSYSNTLTITQDGTVDGIGTLTLVTNNYLNLLGGTLGVSNTTYTNLVGTPFMVGDGVQTAILKARGGTLAFNTGLTISTNATLAGSGVIQSATTVFGNLTPGVNGIGAITNNGAFSLSNNVVSVFDIATNSAGAGAVWDTLVVTNGTLTLGGTFKPVVLGGYIPATNLSFMVMTSSVPLSGAFNSITDGTRVDVLTNAASPKAIGSIRVRINPQSVVLENFNLSIMNGTVFIIR